jgi:competence protein ComEC
MPARTAARLDAGSGFGPGCARGTRGAAPPAKIGARPAPVEVARALRALSAMAPIEFIGPRRPAAWSALLFAGGIAVAIFVPLPLGPALAAAAVLIVVGGVSRRWPRLRWAALVALVPVLGAARYVGDTAVLPTRHILRLGMVGHEGVFSGTVCGEPTRDGDDRTRLTLALSRAEVDGAAAAVSGRVVLICRGFPMDADAGDLVRVRARLGAPTSARNPGAFDYRSYLAAQGIHGLLSADRPDQVLAVVHRPGPWLHDHAVMPIRRAVRRAVAANLEGASAGLVLGMLLGEKEQIPAAVMADFRVTGLAHALVVSGSNVELLAAFFLTAGGLLRMPGRLATAVMIPLVGLYALVTDLQAPVLRAAAMAAVVLVGRLLDRPAEAYNSLGIAALAILVGWPASLAGLSFQLSFAATLGIVALYQPLWARLPPRWRQPGSRLGPWLAAPLAMTLAALAGTAPLLAWQFHQFAPIGLVANVLATPLLSAGLCLGALAALFGWCLPVLGTLFNAANYVVLRALVGLVHVLAQVPAASVATPAVGLPFLAWTTALTVLAALAASRPWARTGALLLLLAGLNVAVWQRLWAPRALQVVCLDVGQGDALFLRFPDGKTALVDAGDRAAGLDSGRDVVLPFLRFAGVDRLDFVLATHAHSDHLGGLVTVLESLPVSHYLDSGQHADTWAARRLAELVAAKGIRYHRLVAGDSLVGLGGVGGLVLHPGAAYVTGDGRSPQGLNNGSVVVRFGDGPTALLLAGDVETAADPALLAWGQQLQAAVVKVPHHGSATSSSDRWLDQIQPRVALLSVGEANHFGHPAPAVLERYAQRGIRVLRTDRSGAVVLDIDAAALHVQTALPAAGPHASQSASGSPAISIQ